MKYPGYLFIGLLLLVLAISAGCTGSQPAPSPTTPSATPPQVTTPAAIVAAPVSSSAAIDTTVNVRFNELACINVQEYLGSTYLYPDQKFRLEAAPPENKPINPNVLFVDENDQLKLRQAKPKWDDVKKTYVYDGPVPLVQFIDITAPVQRDFTVKAQSKYYICVDDRKESGTNDIVYRVPVKLTKL